MEVTCGKPARFEQLFNASHAQGSEAHVHKLPVHRAVFGSSTYIIYMSPERFRHIRIADIGQKSTRIFGRNPFEHAVKWLMKHDGVKVVEHLGIENSGLTHRDPVPKTCFNDLTFGQNFRQGIEVIDADFDGVACPSPMNGRITATGFGHGSDINEFDIVGIGLRLNGFDDVFYGCDVHFERTFGVIIGSRRDQSSHMEHDICAIDAFQYVGVGGEISVDHAHTFQLLIRCNDLSVVLGGEHEQGQIVDIEMPDELFQAFMSHVSGGSGQENILLFH